MSVQRVRFHRSAVRRVAHRLRGLGCAVEVLRHAHGLDLVVDGTAVAVRVTRIARRHHQVTAVRTGKRYDYCLPMCGWMLSVRGRLVHADVWVVVVAARRQWRFFVVPGARLNGRCTLTVCAHRLRPPAWPPLASAHWLADCEDRWALFTAGRKAVAA